MKFLQKIAVFLFVIGSYGCAQLLSPSKGPNLLNTEPSAAEVFDENNIRLGVTPFDLNTVPKNVRQITIKNSGYFDAQLQIKRKPKKELLFLDAMLLCIPCITDLSSNSIYEFSPNKPSIKLRKELTDKGVAINIALDQVYLNSKPDINWLINSKKVKLQDKGMSRTFGQASNSQETVKDAFSKSYLNAIYLKKAESIKSTFEKPRLVIKPVVEEVTFDLTGPEINNYTGKEKLICNWEIYKISDTKKPICTFKTTTLVHRNSGTSAPVLDELMTQATYDFLEIDTLYDYLKKSEKEYFAETKGAPLKINKGKSQKFTDTKSALKNSQSAVVTVIGGKGFGSGSIISPDGYILTNYHVIDSEKDINVQLNSEMKLKASVVKTNPDYDLALIKIEADGLKTIPIGNSDEIETGDEVYAIGTPLEITLGQSITRGIVSGNRTISGMKFIQTDVSINSGNSGGPLINTKGEMVGIATMKSKGEGIEGIGFCIPSNSAVEMLNIIQ